MSFTILTYERIAGEFQLMQNLRRKGAIKAQLKKVVAQAQLVRVGLLSFPKGTSFLYNKDGGYWPINISN